MSEVDFGRMICRDRIMVRPAESAAAKPRILSAPTNSSNLEVAYVEVGCNGIPSGSEVVVEAGVMTPANVRTLGGRQVIVIPLGHVIGMIPRRDDRPGFDS